MKRRLGIVMMVFLLCLLIPSLAFARAPQETPAGPDAEAAPIEPMAEEVVAHEAPELAALVASGALPPLEERIPVDPYVQQVYESIGRYGGTLYRAWTGPDDKLGVGKMTHDWLVRLDDTATIVEPNVAESWEISADFTTYTFTLREGMKWSDGSAFTADGVIFYWDHVITNPDVFYDGDTPWWFLSPISGEPARVEKVDDLHFRMTFDDPYPTLLWNMATNYGDFFGPIPYLKSILPEFAGDAAVQAMADKEGYASIKDFLKWKLKYPFIWPEYPQIRAWIPVNDPRGQQLITRRNPYYWKVDPEGNQLPYIDEVVYNFVQDKELVNLQALAGQVDFQSRHMTGANLSTFLENQDRENYRVVLNAPGVPGDCVGLTFNMAIEDAGLREVFENKNFRLAVSYAMDREEMIEILANGMGEPFQAATPALFPFYDPAWAKMYTEYSPEKAAEYLDAAGLGWDASGEYRLRPDGEPLEVVFEVEDVNANLAELIVFYLNEVGIKAVAKVDDRGLWDVRKNNYQVQMSASGWPGNPFTAPQNIVPLDSYNITFGQYGLWNESDGAEGIRPTGDIAKLAPLWKSVNTARTDAEKFGYLEQIYDIHQDNLWIIGLFSGSQPSYFVVNDKLRNVAEGALNANYMRSPNNLKPWQIYYAE
jgi:peptide/nickel transport system substrate-binding protein